jgi:hypothetical protein
LPNVWLRAAVKHGRRPPRQRRVACLRAARNHTTLDAGGRASTSASRPLYRRTGSGSEKSIKNRAHDSIKERDPAHCHEPDACVRTPELYPYCLNNRFGWEYYAHPLLGPSSVQHNHRRAKVETAIGRWKQVIGDGLRSLSSTACWSWVIRATSASTDPKNRDWGRCVHTSDPCTTLANADGTPNLRQNP